MWRPPEKEEAAVGSRWISGALPFDDEPNTLDFEWSRHREDEILLNRIHNRVSLRNDQMLRQGIRRA